MAKTMKRIFKYALALGEVGLVWLPHGGVVRHFAEQNGQLTIWVEVDPEGKQELRRFTIIGTGHVVPKDGKYIGTTFAGPFVWHLYELKA